MWTASGVGAQRCIKEAKERRGSVASMATPLLLLSIAWTPPASKEKPFRALLSAVPWSIVFCFMNACNRVKPKQLRWTIHPRMNDLASHFLQCSASAVPAIMTSDTEISSFFLFRIVSTRAIPGKNSRGKKLIAYNSFFFLQRGT